MYNKKLIDTIKIQFLFEGEYVIHFKSETKNLGFLKFNVINDWKDLELYNIIDPPFKNDINSKVSIQKNTKMIEILYALMQCKTDLINEKNMELFKEFMCIENVIRKKITIKNIPPNMCMIKNKKYHTNISYIECLMYEYFTIFNDVEIKELYEKMCNIKTISLNKNKKRTLV